MCFYASQCICDCRDELACNCRRFVVDHYRHCWRWQRSTVELKLFRSAAADRQTTEPLASRRLRSLQSARWPTCNVYWIMGIETASIRQCRHDVDCYFLCKQIERPVSRSPVFFCFCSEISVPISTAKCANDFQMTVYKIRELMSVDMKSFFFFTLVLIVSNFIVACAFVTCY